MSYALVCFDKSHYTTYAAAKADQAVSETNNSMDNLEGEWSGVYDLLDMENMINDRLGRDASDMLVFGVVNDKGVFFSLSALTEIRDINQDDIGSCACITDIVG